MRTLEDQSEELSYLRINVTTIKLSHLKIFKKKKLRVEKQLEKFWDSFNTKLRRNRVNREKQWLKITAATLSELQKKSNPQIHDLEPCLVLDL